MRIAVDAMGGDNAPGPNIDGAIAALEEAAVANPYPAKTLYELGRAYELKGDKDKSLEMYKKALEKIFKNSTLSFTGSH